MSAPAGNLGPLPDVREENCEGKNDLRTEELRRALQGSLTYGSEAWLARESGMCLSSVQKAVEGQQRLPAGLVRAALRLRSPEEQAALVSLWLGVPLVHQP